MRAPTSVVTWSLDNEMSELSPSQIEPLLTQIDSDRDQGERFAREMGLGLPRTYWFVSPYRESGGPYPTKPVAAAALKWTDINGGYSKYDSACRLLERAGYIICDKRGEFLFKTNLEDGSAITTAEAVREVMVRIGQDRFRSRLIAKWKCCQATWISDPELLRASHIVPWRDDELSRGDLDNGLLLSALWDAAFDRGLVSFSDEGVPLASPRLSAGAKEVLDFDNGRAELSPGQKRYLKQHRERYGFDNGS